jgi:hypothetical protein
VVGLSHGVKQRQPLLGPSEFLSDWIIPLLVAAGLATLLRMRGPAAFVSTRAVLFIVNAVFSHGHGVTVDTASTSGLPRYLIVAVPLPSLLCIARRGAADRIQLGSSENPIMPS